MPGLTAGVLRAGGTEGPPGELDVLANGEEVEGRRRTGWLLALVGGGLILSLTLWPATVDSQEQIPFWCILCGSRDLADAFLNVLLFMPFGAGLALLRGPWLALVGSGALSGSVEFAQTFLPGRFSTLGDLLVNTSGGLVGGLLATRMGQIRSLLLAPPRLLRLLAVLVPAVAFLASAALSSPRLPGGVLFGQWTRELGHLRAYPGTVLGASVGYVPVPDTRVPGQEPLREALATRDPLNVTFLAGPPPQERSHLFAIFDHQQQGVVMLMVVGDDLVFQRRTLSVPLLLEQPFVRWRGGLSVQEGDTVRIRVWQEPRHLCVAIDARSRCHLSSGVEGGWRLIHRLFRAPAFLEGILGALWLILLALPAGLTARGRRGALMMGAGLALLGAFVSWYSPWLSVGSPALVAPVAGAWVGSRLREGLAGMGARRNIL